MTKQEAIKEAVSALQQRKGDDLYRAKMAFRGLSAEEMQKQHGQSGRTRQQIIDDYKAYEDRMDQAVNIIANL